VSCRGAPHSAQRLIATGATTSGCPVAALRPWRSRWPAVRRVQQWLRNASTVMPMSLAIWRSSGGASEASWWPCGGTSLSCADPADPDRQLALDGLGQQTSHPAGILDVQADQGGVAEHDRAALWIKPEIYSLDLGDQGRCGIHQAPPPPQLVAPPHGPTGQAKDTAPERDGSGNRWLRPVLVGSRNHQWQ
jgi:hypothetical protein